jgi:ABC-type branched-subunit amino acid transport system ATPase component
VFNDTFSLTFALSFVAMVIIGGLGSIPGVILGAALVTLSPYVLSTMTTQLPEGLPFASWLEVNVYYINNALFGVLVLVFLLYQPRGIAGGIQAGGRWLAARTRSTAAPAAEPSSAEPGRGGATTAIEGVPAPADHVASPQATRSTPSVNPPPVDSSAVLKVRNLQLVYRTGARAVDGIDLDVGAGEIVALLGRNGAGKTSTLRAISGFFVADKVVVSGSIQFEGRAIRGASPVVTSRRGVILVPERDKVFPSLTVSEHLALAGASPARRTEVAELFPALSQRTESLAGLLSGGERQMLALAMAWCLEPRLLLIDELSLGLAPAIVKRMMASVRELRDRTNVPILLVEQNLSAALDVADRVYVLEAGRLVMAANAGDVSREALLSSSFGDR